MQNIGNKVWGKTTPLLLSPSFEMHQLAIAPWHVCSKHEHEFKHNAFFVLEGELWLDTWVHSRHEAVPLRMGGSYTVAPGVLHRFRTGALFCRALEMYFPSINGPVLGEDIVRHDTGHEIARA